MRQNRRRQVSLILVAKPLDRRSELSSPRHPTCREDDMNHPFDARSSSHLLSRRQLLQAGGIGALTMTLPGMVAARVNANEPPRGIAAEQSCIFVLLCGGPSHLDTWDLKPNAP